MLAAGLGRDAYAQTAEVTEMIATPFGDVILQDVALSQSTARSNAFLDVEMPLLGHSLVAEVGRAADSAHLSR